MIEPGSRIYLQTMVFGPGMVPLDQLSLDAPRDSDEWYGALMMKQFPGSWLPYGKEQVERSASPHLELVSAESGRLDYIETIKQWRRRFAEPARAKTLLKARLVPRYLTSRNFRLAFTSGVSANSVCFERHMLDHFRARLRKALVGPN